MIVACCLFKYFPYGGLSRDFVRIAQELNARGHQVRAYVQEWCGERVDGIEVIEFSCSSPTNDGRILQYCKRLSMHLQEHPADVVLGFNKMPGLDFYFVADVCYRGKVETEKKGIKGALYRLTPRFKHLSAFEESVFGDTKTKILFLHESQKALFSPYYDLNKKQCYVLPPGISQTCRKSNYPPELVETFRAKLGISSDMKMIVQVGSDFERKGLRRTIKAIAALPHDLLTKTHLFVIGKDDPDSYQEKADRLGIKEHIHFLGGLESAELAIASADLLVHPAFVENTGTVILEAIALNTPILVTENCGYAQYVKDSKAGRVIQSPFVQATFDEELSEMLTNMKALQRYKCNAESFSNRNNFSQLHKKVVDILEDFNK